MTNRSEVGKVVFFDRIIGKIQSGDVPRWLIDIQPQNNKDW